MVRTPELKNPVAVIGVGAVMPDANDAAAFWQNIVSGRYSIREVPAKRWAIEDYYDPDPRAPDKTHVKIGAFVEGFAFDAVRHRIPPRVAASMDDVQKWAIEAARQALADAGYDRKDFARERTAVIVGNAMGSELHHLTNMRVTLPRVIRALKQTPAYLGLDPAAARALADQLTTTLREQLPPLTEDSMPGELSNIIAGRVAAVFDLRGANFTTDAACASSMAALQAALDGLEAGRFDMALLGGSDSSMSPMTYVKFCKIGALSPDLSCPFDERANGFVMGEGAGMLLLKRLADAERDGDRIYAVIRGMGSASDGKGKGITAPNPIGQRLAMQRAYRQAGISPAEVTLLEAHGTSTTVGDMVEAEVANELFAAAGARPGSVAVGSVKSQIGHLKSAAGIAALLKTALALHHKVLPGSLNFERPNPKIPFGTAPLTVNTRTRPWEIEPGRARVAGVSSFGFGGTNFHVVLSEHRTQPQRTPPSSGGPEKGSSEPMITSNSSASRPKVFLAAAPDAASLVAEVEKRLGQPPESDDAARDPTGAERAAFSYRTPAERESRGRLLLSALKNPQTGAFRALQGQGIFRSSGQGKVAFLFPGQGSQSIGMLRELRERFPVVAETFAEADRVMRAELPRPLSEFIFAEDTPENQAALRETKVCQPAMLAADIALCRLLETFGIRPDMVAGHSLGEYAALVAGGMLGFADSLLAVSARAREMSGVQVADPGRMAAVMGPAEALLPRLQEFPGVVAANFNSPNQTVIAGATEPMNRALAALEQAGIRAVPLNVSHAFHSHIVAPAVEPLHRVLSRLPFSPPRIPIVANLDAEPYEMEPAAMKRNLERLSRQVASPVQFVRSVQKLHAMGARLFVEVGPRRVLANFVQDILPGEEVLAVSCNHPKLGDLPSLGLALAACAAAGVDGARDPKDRTLEVSSAATAAPPLSQPPVSTPSAVPPDFETVRAKVLEIAAKKTGYPVEMLDPELDLEADLGIDTVKQAEMFSEIRAAFNIPRPEGLKL
ncbi:MAG: acyltransferase domain-containing protein, partial [Myxococcales bacterium]|nr:acyltransferase domain-containing protein [Myxococcales bacterium]